MTSLKDKIKTALDESRMLILGAQVLVGFNFRSVFEEAFDELSPLTQYLKMGSLGVLLLTLALLMSPGAYHRIVHGGEDSDDVHSFATMVMDWALLPFALALSADIGVATAMLMGRTSGLIAAVIACVIALFLWYGVGWLQRSRKKQGEERRQQVKNDVQGSLKTKLHDKIEQVLTEARVVLPGAQALVGFQFATMLMTGFEKLPKSSKNLHLVSLTLMALSIMLLMAPAAYHRIVEQGEDTEAVHRFASWMLLAAMVPLALGICGDFFVVLRKVTQSTILSLVLGLILLASFYGLWFGYTLYRRSRL